jgi:hypothetical protein
MFGASPLRALTRPIKNVVSVHEIPAAPGGGVTCKGVQLTSSVAAIVKMSEKPIESKDKDGKDAPVTLSFGEGVIYLPPDVPVTVISGQRFIYAKSLDKDGVFCAAPIVSA